MRRQLTWMRSQGESLIEVVIAVTILTVVFASIFGTLIQASAANTNVINRVVALNIAREGVEAVRNIRDTNWLKYSGDRREKWLCLDTFELANGNFIDAKRNACADEVIRAIVSRVYTVEFVKGEFADSVTGEIKNIARYFLQSNGGALTDAETLPLEAFRLYQGIDGRVSHNKTGEILAFYRQIYLEPEDAKIGSACTSPGCPKNVRLRVLVRVQWEEGNKVRSLDVEAFLYDFLGRESY